MFTKALIAGKGLNELIKIASRLLNNPIILTTTSYRILCMYDNNNSFYDLVWKDAKNNGICSKEIINLFESQGVTELVVSNEQPVLLTEGVGKIIPRILKKITINNSIVAYLGILIVNNTDTTSQIPLVNNLCDIIAMVLSNDKYYLDDTHYSNNIIIDLLDGKKI